MKKITKLYSYIISNDFILTEFRIFEYKDTYTMLHGEKIILTFRQIDCLSKNL